MGKARAYALLMVLGVAGILLLFNANSNQKKEVPLVTDLSAWGGASEAHLPFSFSPDALVGAPTLTSGLSAFSPALNEWQAGSISAGGGSAFGGQLSGNAEDKQADKYVGAESESRYVSPLNNKTEQKTQTGYDPFFLDAYSLIPKGPISSSMSQILQKPLTTEEKGFFDYGNAIGSQIRSFDDSHKDTTAILDAFFKDYKSQSKIEPLLSVAGDYERLARDLEAMENVPKELSGAHTGLSKSYRAVSNGLIQLTKAGSDKEMADSVLAYDASAEEFIKNFIAIAEFFSVRGVKFSESDPGSIFQFSN